MIFIYFIYIIFDDRESDIQRVIITHHKGGDYDLGDEEIVDISLVGEGDITEEVRGVKKESLFNRNFKVSIFDKYNFSRI